MPAWDDGQYLKFAEQRTRPARELLARVPLADARSITDLGCGPGNSTSLLCERFPAARLIGIDSSPEMLARARKDWPNIIWQLADVANYRAPEPLDLLFGNAVLQWLPEHARLLPELFEQVAKGGVLALQMPINFEEPSHRAMRELEVAPASEGAGARLAQVRSLSRVFSPDFYYDLLAPHAAHLDIWITNYQHVMASPEAIVEWVKGTGLRPYLDALTEDERPQYLERYTQAIDRAYPARSDGRRLFAFPRLFIVAVRA